MQKEKETKAIQEPKGIPDGLHLLISLIIGFVMLLVSYFLILIVLDLVSRFVFKLNPQDYWIGIISISLSFLISYSYLRRRRRKTEPVNQKRNWRWASNAIAISFLVFLGFIAFRVYQKTLSLPDLNNYLPKTEQSPMDSIQTDSSYIDTNAHSTEPIDSL